MDDAISRQAAIDELVKMLGYHFQADEEVLDAVVTTVRELPSAQPEIIRCKDCKYWDTTWQNDYAPNYHYCPMIDSTRRNDFYCADAGRRTDG